VGFGAKSRRPGSAPRAARRLGHAVSALFAAAFLLGAGGCRLGTKQADYFPLDAGWTWRYRVNSEIKNVGKEHTAMLVTNRDRLVVQGRKVVPRLYHDGHRYYYVAQDDGVRLVADRAPGAEVKPARPDQYVLKYPLKAGTSWPVWSHTSLLRRQVFSPTRVIMVPITTPIEVTYTIEGKGDVVKVPAGTFRDCLRLRGKASAKRDLGDRIGEVEVSVETTEWFAPGVGLVKMVRKEDSQPESPFAGAMTVELEKLDKATWFQ